MKFDIYVLSSAILNSLVELYVIGKILNKRVIYNKNRYNFIITMLCLTIYQTITYLLTNSFIRPILSLIAIICSSKFLFKEKWNKSIISSFISWLIILVSEIIFMIFDYFLFGLNIDQIQEQTIGKLIFNLIIFAITVIIINIKPLLINVRNFADKFYDIKKNFLTKLIFLTVSAFSIGIYLINFNVDTYMSFILILIVIIIYIFILISLFNEKNNNMRMQQNIESISANLDEYESMLDYQRVANHENKNQLLVIKGKIKKGDSDIIDYIDNLIKDSREDNEIFYGKTKLIPTGGLQGLIYYKGLLIRDKNIDLYLEINRNIKSFPFKSLSVNENSNLCKIVGVWIDNAIQSVENLEEKKIGIDIFCDKNELIIQVFNNFIGELDLNRIDDVGYTTKGKGHGYGLCLVKNIIENNSNFKNIKKINKNVFIQELQIKK